MVLRQRLEFWLSKPLAPHEWGVCLTDDVAFLTPVHDVGPGKPGVKLPLADTDFPTFTFTVLTLELFDVGLQFVEMMNTVIRDTNGADLAGLLGFYKCSPCSISAFLAAVWGV